MDDRYKFFLILLLSTINSTFSYTQTGIQVPGMSTCDQKFRTFLGTYAIPGASIAMTKNGKLVYLRAFGFANAAKTEITQPHHLFRIASVSKPITAISIIKLVEENKLKLNDLVFGPTGILKDHPIISKAKITDNRIFSITVQHLLEHSAGWNRDIDCFPNPTSPYTYNRGGCDPIAAPLHVTRVTNTTNPVSEEALITFLLEKGLNFAPGTDYAYSNIGYLVLGEIIEVISKMSYEDFVKATILEPLHICDMHLARNLLKDKQDREVEYIGNGGTSPSCYGNGTNVPWEYGGFNIEAMDAHGGWIATASDLVKLIVSIDGFTTKPDILNATSVITMTKASLRNPNYAKGWAVNSANNWWHTGALDGTASFICRSNSQYTWAILLNKRVIDAQQSASFWTELDALPWDCISTNTAWPTYDLMLNPSTQSSNITSTKTGNTAITLSWTKGNGTHRLLLASTKEITEFPLDGKEYSADSSFAAGTNLGNQNYAIYNGTGSSVTVKNLVPNTKYYFKILEYNKTNATGNHALYKLCEAPTIAIQTLTSVIDQSPLEDQVKIYPNPSSQNIKIITTQKFTHTSVSIINQTGSVIEKIESKNSKDSNIEMSDYKSGLYFIQLQDSIGNKVTKKIIKIEP